MAEEKLEVQKLIEDLKSSDNTKKIIAQKILLEKGENWLEYLISRLGNEPVDVQCVICQALGSAKDQRAFEPLVKLFEHENMTLRCYAAGAIGRLGDNRAIIPLKLALTEYEENPLVRGDVATALGNLGNNEAVEPLIEALKNDKDKEVRSKAALALGMLSDLRAVEPLIERIGYDFYVQRNAAIALGLLKDKRGIEPLIGLLHDQILGEIAHYALASIDSSFLAMSKDEILARYKKSIKKEEETSEEPDIILDLEDLLKNLQEKKSDEKE